LLNAIVKYLPNPSEITNEGLEITDSGEEPVVLSGDTDANTVALAFKLEDGRYGQLTYLRIYQGRIERDTFIHNTRTSKKHRVGRLVLMHSDEMEEISSADAGDIVAIFGIDCRTGDTFTDGEVKIAMTSMHVPDPVISLSIHPVDNKAEINVSKALHRFTKEDPTFRVHTDKESGETVISGMGELHLDVYIERMRREYGAEVETSPPRVAYRETLTRKIEFNYLHKKQTGGSGQYGRVGGFLEPCEEEFEFVDEIVGGAIPRQFIPAVEKGFRSMLEKGRLIGAPVVNVRALVNDGNHHAVDSSEMAFQEAARGAWREAFSKGRPKILEPVMKVVAEGPAEFSGAMLGTLMQRRGQIVGTEEGDGQTRITADVPLAEMFGYATLLRSNTKGKAEFTMEFSRYLQVPESVSKELLEKAQAEKK
jgi:elongation factor G